LWLHIFIRRESNSVFITFEGPEGSGKTTQIRLLADWLQSQGRGVVTTREPGGTRIGNGVRGLLLDINHTEMTPRTETLLFNAARAQIVHEVIRPGLESGKIVLCDRFFDSTLAYQGYGYGQDRAELERIIRYATGGLTPDLTIYLDVQPEVQKGYEELIRAEPQRWAVIASEMPAEAVHGAIVALVASRLSVGVDVGMEGVLR
jgi:dTMP kinase